MRELPTVPAKAWHAGGGSKMTEHVSLSAFLAPLSAAIKSVAVSTWVAAEISEISDRNHVYITLIETGESGKVAELRVSIWSSGKQKLLDRFSEGTGGEKLRKGIKVLLKLKPALHPLYGLTATVEGIDPTYTLGDSARKLQELRQRLITEGAYDRQRTTFTPPEDFTRVAIICPAGAAGEGDFRSHADPLQAVGLCQFDYWNATFQGERTSGEVVAALRAVYSAHREKPFDAVIILRGGGAQSDLAWLNDYEISNAISKMPLPVLVAIGHERDTTILDEIANVSFHTPSKAIGHVTACIFDNARAAIEAFESIISTTTKTHALFTESIARARESIHTASVHQLRVAIDTVAASQQSITAGAHFAIEHSAQGIEQNISMLKDGARRQVETAARTIDTGVNDVVAGADKAVAAVESGMARSREVIHGAATRGIAVAENQIDGWRLLTRDRAYLGRKIMADGLQAVTGSIHAAAVSDIAAVETDIQVNRGLIRDRSFLAVRNIQDRVKASAEFVLGLGPEQTLQRGFVMARHRDGKPVTRRAQVSAGERIQLQFADGNVGAIAE
jgi:exodeoxyribonuclease VII large subunit